MCNREGDRKGVVPGQVFMNRRTSLRAESSSQVFAGSRTVPEDKVPGHKPEGSKSAGPVFKTGVRARARGGLDSRPPPLRDSGFDQHRCARRPKATQGKRVPRVPKTGQPHQSSLISQVFARSPLLRTGQVFPARSGELDKSSVPTIAGWRAGVVGHPSVARRRRPRDGAAPCRDC